MNRSPQAHRYQEVRCVNTDIVSVTFLIHATPFGIKKKTLKNTADNTEDSETKDITTLITIWRAYAMLL